MRHLVVLTAVAGIHFVADVACMCSTAAGTVGAAAVLVLPGMHCSLAVGSATAVAIVAVSVVSGAIAAGVTTWFLSAAVFSTPLVCRFQTCPFLSVLS